MEEPLPNSPLVKFYRFIPGARAPQRADRSAAGSMPTRAFRYCEAMRTASALGWYIFPPMNFKLMWDGANDVIVQRHLTPRALDVDDRVSPVTVPVSARLPILRSALIVAVNEPVSSTPSRLNVLNPCNVKVTV